MRNSQTYAIYGVGIQIQCSEPWLAEEVDRIVCRLGFLHDGEPRENPGLCLDLGFQSWPGLHYSFEDAGVAEGLRVVRVGDQRCFTDGRWFLHMGEGAVGLALLEPSFCREPIGPRMDLLFISLLALLRRGGLYEVHSAGLARDGLGLLLVAGPGCGKSTVTVSLIRKGWHYLSDDLLWLKSSPQGVLAIALRKALYVDPVVAHKYPELGSCLVSNPAIPGGKCWLNIQSAYPGQQTDTCHPQVLLFPSIVPAATTRLVPVGRAKALAQLISHSRSIVIDNQAAARRRLETLKCLAQQAEAYELAMGLDLYHCPDRVVDFLPSR